MRLLAGVFIGGVFVSMLTYVVNVAEPKDMAKYLTYSATLHSVFGAFGCKRKVMELNLEGEPVQRKYIDFRFTLDERTVDGFYYAAFLKYLKRVFYHPELLDTPPEEVVKDVD